MGGNGHAVDAGFMTQAHQARQVRVKGGFATGEIDDFSLRVVGPYHFQDAGKFVGGHVEGLVVFVDRIADGAVQVAQAGDGNDRQVGLLLMAGAGPAVVGTAGFDRVG